MDQAVAATPSKTLRLLLVEDDPDERLIAQFWLAQADGANYDVTWAATYDEGLERLHDDEFDACLVDHRLGPHDSLEFLRAAHAGGYSVPIIVLTGTDSRKIDGAAMRLGAADFLVKSQVTPSILDRSLRRAVQRQSARTTIGPRAAAAAERHEGPTVLIVDDREVNHYVLGRALTDGGYGVVEASSGAEALARAREGVDLVVLDARLPDLDGFEVCRRLKLDPLTSRLPVVMCSAHLTGSADRIAGLEGGADAYLDQPFEPREALATVAALLRARQEAESRLSWVVDQVPCLVWTLDTELRFASVSGGSLARLGLDPADLLGRRLADVAASGEGTDLAVEAHGLALAGQERSYRRRAWGRWLDVRVQPLRNAGGGTVGCVGVAVDVTDQIEAEADARRSAVELATVFQSTGDAVFTLDADWRFALVNREAERVLSRSAASLVGRNLWEEFPAALGSTFEREYRRAARDRTPVEFREYFAPLGAWFEVRAFPTDTGLSVYFRDITERVRHQETLAESRRFLRSSLDALTANVTILDERGTLMEVNESWRRFGRANGGTTVEDGAQPNYLAICDAATGAFSEEAAAMAAGIRDVIAGRQAEFSMEYPCHSPAEQRWFAARVTRFAGDGPARVLVAHEDVTQLRVAEAAAREANERSLREYRLLIERLDALAKSIGAANGLTDVCRALLSFVEASAPCDGMLVSLYDAKRRERTLVFSAGPDGRDDVSGLPALGMNGSPQSRAIETGDAVVIGDFQASLRSAGVVPARLGIEADPDDPQSSVAVPMVVQGRVVGVFEVQSSSLDAYRDEHVTALRAAANLAAIAVENARLLNDERRASEEARAAAERFRLLFEHSPDGIVLLDPDDTEVRSRIVDCNQAYARMNGYERAELIGRPVDLLHPAPSAPGDAAQHVRWLEGGGATVNVVHQRKDGTTVPIEAVTALVAVGGRRLVLGVDRDVSERIAAEQALRLSEERFRSLVQNASDCVTVVDELMRPTYQSPASERVFGRPPEVMLDDGFRFVHPDDQAGIGSTFGTMVEQGLASAGATFRFQDASGCWRWIESSATNLLSDPAVGGVVINSRDITERRQAADALNARAAEARDGRAWFEALVESVDGIVWEAIQGPGGWRHSFVSRRAETLLGYPVEAWMQSPTFWEDHLHPEDREAAELRTIEGVLGEAGYELEYRMLAADGRTIWFRSLVTPLLDSDGRRRARGVMIDQTEKKLDEERLRALAGRLAHDAQHDALTGLPNRSLYEDRLSQALERARRSGRSAAVLFLDLDGFKRVNDTLGHHAGDDLLREVARRLEGRTRAGDTLARRGGDEFLVVAENVQDATEAVRLANRLLEALADPVTIGGQEVFVTASVGVAVFPQDGADPETLQRNADAAMYRSKAQGRNRIECYAPEMNAAAAERLSLEADLRRGLARDEIRVHYQPQVDASTRAVTGLEALVRWDHPTRGLVPPGKFLPVAEDTGLIGEIDGIVLREACRQSAAWRRAGLAPVTVAVNVSAFRFGRADLAGIVRSALEESGLEPGGLELELSETFVMSDPAEAVAQIERLRALGVRLAIDDFGTGHSSLAYLQKLDFDTLKIDRSFVSGMPTDLTSRTVVRAIVELAHNLGMTVVAEGVETPEQANEVLALGCESIQGYLYGKPAPAADAEARLARRA